MYYIVENKTRNNITEKVELWTLIAEHTIEISSAVYDQNWF